MVLVTVIEYTHPSLFSCGIDDLYNCKYDYRSSACQPQYIKVMSSNRGISQLKKLIVSMIIKGNSIMAWPDAIFRPAL